MPWAPAAPRKASAVLWVVLSSMLVAAGCGGASMSPNSAPVNSGGVPQFDHVLVVVEENQSYANVIGNPAAPFLNSLALRYGLATSYFADAHPSLPNYFMLTAGAAIAMNDAFAGTVTQDNVVRALVNANKSWRCYADSIPSVGYLGPDSGSYIRHHVPFAYISDVVNEPTQAANLVPASQLTADLANSALPNYAFIVPNAVHDGHNCLNGGTCANNDKIAQIDMWLQSTIQPVLDSPDFQDSGLLLVTFDEGDIDDTAHGGGHVTTLVISSKAKSGFQSTTFYQHQSTLALMLTALRVSDLPGAAATAPSMAEFFRQ